MDRRFVVILAVSLLFAAGATLTFELLAGPEKHPVWATIGLLVLIGLVSALVAFLLWPSLRDQRRVGILLEAKLGIRSWATLSAGAMCVDGGAKAKWKAAIGLTVCLTVFAVGYLVIRSLVPSLILTAWVGLMARHLRSPSVWAERLSNLAFTSGAFLFLLSDKILPAHSLLFNTIAGVLFIGAMVVSTRGSRSGQRAVEALRWAYNNGDYAGALAAARHLDSGLAFDQRGELSTLALTHFRRREFAEAEVLLRQSLAVQSTPERAAALCVTLANVVERGRFEEASRSLDAAAELVGKDDAAVTQARALLLLRRGGEPEAALALAQAAATSGTDRSAVIRAWALAENGCADEARQEVAIRAQYTGHTKPDLAERSYYSGRALLCCGDRVAAEEYFRQAIEAEPQGLFGALSEALMP